MLNEERVRIESKIEVKTYLDQLKYALSHGANLEFQRLRNVDDNKEEKYTNKYTIQELFPDEDPKIVLRRELQELTCEEYIHTVKDLKFINRSEMRVFGKKYEGSKDVYIKIRVELLGDDGKGKTFIMSFHFSQYPFSNEMFPYRNK